MIRKKTDSFLNQKSIYFLKSHFTSNLSLIVIVFINLFFLSCSSTKRFTGNEEKTIKTETEKGVNNTENKSENTELASSEIRVSMQGLIPSESLLIGSSVNLLDNNNTIAVIKAGNKIECFYNNGETKLVINDQEFEGNKFFLTSTDIDEIIKINGNRYRGKIQISVSNSSVDIINIVNLEDYVKGVLAKEMPIGKNEENLEALKALAICVRTYAIQKMKNGKVYFDIYADTRDQVYGGEDAETPVSNKATNETTNVVLKYEGNPATIFYHSTCGGYTEAVENVFTKEEIPYLISVKDGDEPNCKISPRFEWEENYQNELIVRRLKDYNLLDNQTYELEDITIDSRFESGRVNELEINLRDESGEIKSVLIRGNEIRSVIRNENGKSILWSTMFDISTSSNSVTLTGKGFGHGVGLCQWGAISLSKKGWDYEQILSHYYPGTIAEKIND